MQAAGQDVGGVAIRLRAAQSDLRSVELMRSVAGPAAGWQRVLWSAMAASCCARPVPLEIAIRWRRRVRAKPCWTRCRSSTSAPGCPAGVGAFPTGDAPAATGLELIIARGPPGELQRYRRVYALH